MKFSNSKLDTLIRRKAPFFLRKMSGILANEMSVSSVSNLDNSLNNFYKNYKISGYTKITKK